MNIKLKPIRILCNQVDGKSIVKPSNAGRCGGPRIHRHALSAAFSAGGYGDPKNFGTQAMKWVRKYNATNLTNGANNLTNCAANLINGGTNLTKGAFFSNKTKQWNRETQGLMNKLMSWRRPSKFNFKVLDGVTEMDTDWRFQSSI